MLLTLMQAHGRGGLYHNVQHLLPLTNSSHNIGDNSQRRLYSGWKNKHDKNSTGSVSTLVCVALTLCHLEWQRQLSNPSERLLLKTLACLFSKGQMGETNLPLFSYACWPLLSQWKESKEKITGLRNLHWRIIILNDNVKTWCGG